MTEPTPLHPRRRYTRKQKAVAVGIAAVDGVTRAGEVTGIAKQTIDYWLHDPEFGQLRTTAREVVVEQFWMGIQVGIQQVTEGLRGDAPLREKASALDNLVEKFALLSGEATNRTEHRELLNGFDDGEKEAAAEWLMTVARERLHAAE